MFKRRSKSGYKVDNLGGLIVERVQLPYSLVQLDGTEYKIQTWTYYLRLDGGPIFFERNYAAGTDEDFAAMNSFKNLGKRVGNTEEANYFFYSDLRALWRL